MSRSTTRKPHETLTGDFAHLINVVILFFNLYRDYKIDLESLATIGINDKVFIPFHHEKENW